MFINTAILPKTIRRHYMPVISLFMFFTSISSGIIQAQKNKAPSTTQLMQERIDSAYLYIKEQPLLALDYASACLQYAIQKKNLSLQNKSYLLLAEISFQMNQYESALENLNKSGISKNIQDALSIRKKISKSQQEEMPISFTLQQWELKASIYKKQGEYHAANSIYESLIDWSQGYKNEEREGKYRLMLAKSLEESMSFKEAEEVFVSAQNSISKYESNKGDKLLVERGIANVQLKRGKFDDAEGKLKESLELARQVKDTLIIAESLDLLGNVYKASNQLDKELDVREALVKIGQETSKSMQLEQAKHLQDLANTQAQAGNIQHAQSSYEQGVRLAKNNRDTLREYAILSEYISFLHQQGMHAQAAPLFDRYTTLGHAIAKTETLKHQVRIDDIQTMMNRLQNLSVFEKEKVWMDQAIQRQQWTIYILSSLLLVILIISLFVFRLYRAKKRSNLLLDLKSMRAQMNPHFIFNALNSINAFIAEQNVRLANKYLSDFSRLIRQVLENSKNDWVPLYTEVELLQSYLHLEHLRFSDVFDYEFILDDRLETEMLIPPMMIQPFLENAVWHGLRYRKSKGFLSIHISKQEEHVLVDIQDNGIGRKASQALKTKHQLKQNSTALKNITHRIKIINQLYKLNYHYHIEDLKEGTRITLKLKERKS